MYSRFVLFSLKFFRQYLGNYNTIGPVALFFQIFACVSSDYSSHLLLSFLQLVMTFLHFWLIDLPNFALTESPTLRVLMAFKAGKDTNGQRAWGGKRCQRLRRRGGSFKRIQQIIWESIKINNKQKTNALYKLLDFVF